MSQLGRSASPSGLGRHDRGVVGIGLEAAGENPRTLSFSGSAKQSRARSKRHREARYALPPAPVLRQEKSISRSLEGRSRQKAAGGGLTQWFDDSKSFFGNAPLVRAMQVAKRSMLQSKRKARRDEPILKVNERPSDTLRYQKTVSGNGFKSRRIEQISNRYSSGQFGDGKLLSKRSPTPYCQGSQQGNRLQGRVVRWEFPPACQRKISPGVILSLDEGVEMTD